MYNLPQLPDHRPLWNFNAAPSKLSAVTHVMALVCSEPELMLGQISNLADLIREEDGKGDAESEYKQKESELKIKL